VVIARDFSVWLEWACGRSVSRAFQAAAGKVVVFGLLKRNGKVYTVTVANISDYPTADYPGADKAGQRSLYRLSQYPNVLDVSEFNHLRINHRTCFADRQNHINGIENFWSQAKRHLRKFNGIPKKHFELYLKECEWRFNNNEMKSQIAMLKQMVRDSLSWLSRSGYNIFIQGGETTEQYSTQYK